MVLVVVRFSFFVERNWYIYMYIYIFLKALCRLLQDDRDCGTKNK